VNAAELDGMLGSYLQNLQKGQKATGQGEELGAALIGAARCPGHSPDPGHATSTARPSPIPALDDAEGGAGLDALDAPARPRRSSRWAGSWAGSTPTGSTSTAGPR
jgi:hypothetical protein